MISDIKQGIAYLRSHGIVSACSAAICPRNKHPFLQFAKYGICGVVATILHQAVFAATGYTIFPHFEEVYASLGLSIHQRIVNFSLSSLAGFIVSDVACYLMNIRFVFEGGRHHGAIEFLLFTLVASVGFFVGLGLAVAALKTGTTGSWGANFALIATSIIVNFLCRKFFVFKG